MDILTALKKHKFKNGSVLTYTTLNDESDTTTPSDPANLIYKTFSKSGVSKAKTEMLEAIFDGEYDIVEDADGKHYLLMNPKTKKAAKLEVADDGKGTLELSANGVGAKFTFAIRTPDVVKQVTPDPVLQTENTDLEKFGIKITRKDLKEKDYLAIAKLFTNMAKTS